MPVTRHPRHRSRRAALPHRAPASGHNAQAHGGACRTRLSAGGRRPRHGVRLLVCSAPFPLASSLPSTCSAGPLGRPLCAGFLGTLQLADSLHPSLTGVPLGCTGRTWPYGARPDAGPPGFRSPGCHACRGLRPRRVRLRLARTAYPLWPSACAARVGTQDWPIAGRNTLPACAPVNAAPTPLPTPAHDSGPVWLAGPSLSGTCTLHHCAGLSRR